MPSHAQDMTLTLENLPERAAPARKAHTVHFLEVDPKTQERLDECDWNLYESTVASGLVEAGRRYAGSSARPEAIFQVSVVTDPQRQITGISLGTKPHAKAKIREMVRGLRARGEQYAAEKLELAGLNPNPAEFHHPNYYTILHRELKPLSRIDYGDDENNRAAEVWIKTSLLKAVEHVRSLNLLATWPREEAVWIGVNPPRDWYDHVTKI